MANKAVPTVIEGSVLHPKATQRTNRLLSELETVGVGPVSKVHSGIDRLRLVASAYFTLLDEVNGSADTDTDVDTVRDEVAQVASDLC